MATAKEFQEAQWALAKLDATQKNKTERDAVVPHIATGKQPK
jgi:hypothetical protein